MSDTSVSTERPVMVETKAGGTVELIAENDQVVIEIAHGDRFQRVIVSPSVATNLGRRLQGVATKALDLRDSEAARR